MLDRRPRPAGQMRESLAFQRALRAATYVGMLVRVPIAIADRLGRASEVDRTDEVQQALDEAHGQESHVRYSGPPRLE